MQHYHLNEFATGHTFLHRFEARAKTISIFFLIAVAVSLRGLFALFTLLILALMLNLIIKLPINYLATRISVVIPFALASVIIFPLITPGDDILFLGIFLSQEGLEKAGMYILRFGVSFLLLMFLTASIGFNGFLHSLARLKVPKIFLQLTEFAVRYFFVMHTERKAMLLARKSRNFKTKSILSDPSTLRTLGQTVGMLFFRAYTRAEKIYLAMLARGYKGIMPVMQLQELELKDYVISCGLFVLGVIILLLDKGVIA